MNESVKRYNSNFAERVIDRAINTGAPIAVFYDPTGPTAMRADTTCAHRRMAIAPHQLVGIYDDDCSLDWLVADLAYAAARQ